jgi:DNA repair protein RecO (recombination protein O)
MEETYNIKAIILNRYDFRESDSRIICYSADRGKLELVARGAKKIKSKSAGHLEPLTLSRLMVVHGKDFDYAGTAVGENFYPEIKNNLEKTQTAIKALLLVEKMTRENELDGHEDIFILLKIFLEKLEGAKSVVDQPKFSEFNDELAEITGFSQEDFEELRLK